MKKKMKSLSMITVDKKIEVRVNVDPVNIIFVFG